MQKGKYTYPDGSKYVGEFKDGKRHGKGVLIRPNGLSYEGEWQNNMPHGQGIATAPDGKKRIGEWKNGKFVGEAQPSIKQNQNMKKLEEGDCRSCGEELKKQEDQENVSCLKFAVGAITLFVFVFFGYLVWGWVGGAFGLLLWLVALGSIGLSKDIMDAGEAARRSKSD